MADEHEVMLISEVAHLFRVAPSTIWRWEAEGRFRPGTVFRTLGGQRRFYRDKIMALLENGQEAGK